MPFHVGGFFHGRLFILHLPSYLPHTAQTQALKVNYTPTHCTQPTAQHTVANRHPCSATSTLKVRATVNPMLAVTVALHDGTNGKVCAIATSYDQSFLMSAGSDSNLYVPLAPATFPLPLLPSALAEFLDLYMAA